MWRGCERLAHVGDNIQAFLSNNADDLPGVNLPQKYAPWIKAECLHKIVQKWTECGMILQLVATAAHWAIRSFDGAIRKNTLQQEM